MTLAFAFRSRRFRAWLKAPGPSLPSWSPAEKRWRGLGLIMVRNLACLVAHRSGPAGDRILVTLRAERGRGAVGTRDEKAGGEGT